MVLLALEDMLLAVWFWHQLHELSKLLQVQKRAVNNLVTSHHLGELARTPISLIFLREINFSALCVPSVPRKMFVDEVE